KYDSKILIEQAVKKPREIECSGLGNDDPKARGLGEINPHDEFYSYDTKDAATSHAELIIPATVGKSRNGRIRKIALDAYQALQCTGMARVDFLLGSDGKLFLNELNTIPGFTNISMYPKLWRESGLSYNKLIERLIELALEA